MRMTLLVVVALCSMALAQSGFEAATQARMAGQWGKAAEIFESVAATAKTDGLVVARARAATLACRARGKAVASSIAALERLFADAKTAAERVVIALELAGVLASAPQWGSLQDGVVHYGEFLQGAERVDLQAQNLCAALVAYGLVVDNHAALEAESANAPLMRDWVWSATLALAGCAERYGELRRDAEVGALPLELVPAAWRSSVHTCLELSDRAYAFAEEHASEPFKGSTAFLRGSALWRVLSRDVGDLIIDEEGCWHINFSDRPELVLPSSPIDAFQRAAQMATDPLLRASAELALARCQERACRFVACAASCERVLAQEPTSLLADDARELLESITLPQIRSMPPVAVRPGQSATVEARWRNVESIKVRIVALPLAELVASARGLRDADFEPQSVASLLAALAHGLGSIRSHHALEFRADAAADHRWQRQLISLPPLSAGTWCIRLSGGGVERCELLMVSDLALLRLVEEGQCVHFAASHSTGQALAGVRLSVRETMARKGLLGRYQSTLVQSAETDAKGMSTLGVGNAQDVLWSSTDTVAVHGAHAAILVRESVARSSDRFGERVAWCERAQPLWRPGQRVELLFLLRERRSANRWELWPREPIPVELRSPDGERVLLAPQPMDSSGALAVTYELPCDVATGEWLIWLGRDHARIHAGSFRVEEYRKPSLSVRCTGPRSPVRLGQTLHFEIETQSLTGESLEGALVQWSATRHPEWLDATRPPNAATESPEPAGSGSVRMDGGGKCRLEIDTSAFASRKSASRFFVEVQVEDAALRKASASGQFVVARSALSGRLRLAVGYGLPGERIPLIVSAQNVQSQRVSARGVLEVHQILSGHGTTERLGLTVYAQAVECSADREQTLHWQASEVGRFLVRLRLEDPIAGFVTTEQRIWIHAPGLDTRAFELKGITLAAHTSAVAPESAVRCLITTERAEADVLLLATAARGPTRLLTGRAQGGVLSLEVPVGAQDVPLLCLRAYSATHSGFATDALTIDVPPVRHTLNVNMRPIPLAHRPGDECEIDVSVRDASGQPVAARVLLAVHDAALDELEHLSASDILSFFYRRDRARAANTSASTGLVTEGFDRAPTDWSNVHPLHWMPGGHNDLGRTLRWRTWREAMGPLPSTEASRAEFEILFGRIPSPRRGLKHLLDGVWGLGSVRAEASGRAVASEAGFLGRDGSTTKDFSGASSAFEVTVRQDFRDMAVFARELQCDADGCVRTRFRLPEDLAHWRGRIVAWTAETAVGDRAFDTQTKLPVQARVILPRALVAGDRCDVRLLGTRTEGAVSRAEWKLTTLEGDGQVGPATPSELTLHPGNTTTAIAPLQVASAGKLALRAELRGPEAASSDGMNVVLTVKPDGTPVTDTHLFNVAAGATAQRAFVLPEQLAAGSAHVRVEVRSSMVLQLLDSVPWLIEEPWDCTDHVIARFVPAALVRHALESAGLHLEDLAEAAERAPRPPQVEAPKVVRSRDIDRVIERCRRQLRAAQNADGGFGWWEDSASSVCMTARVLDGLQRATAVGVTGLESIRRRAAAWLEERARQEPDDRRLAQIALALALEGKCPEVVLNSLVLKQAELPTLSVAELARALWAAGRHNEARHALAALLERAHTDRGAGTLSFPITTQPWAWWNARIETAATALEALLDIDSQHAAIPLLTQTIFMNRRAQGWANARDTARAIQSLLRTALNSGDLDADLEVEMEVAGQRKELQLTGQARNLPQSWDVPIVAGKAATLRVRTRGHGKAHVLATLHAVAIGDDIRANEYGLSISRRWFRVAQDGRVAAEVAPGELVVAGTRLRTQLELRAAMDAEYVLVRDPRAAGFEPVLKTSGWQTQSGMRLRREVREDHNAYFLEHVQQGTHILVEDVHVETTGSLKALPSRIEALYAPEYCGNGTARRFEVVAPERQGQ